MNPKNRVMLILLGIGIIVGMLLFPSVVSAKIFYAPDTYCRQISVDLEPCNETSCPGGFCTPGVSICCGEDPQNGVKIYPGSLSFIPSISLRYYSSLLDYVNPTIIDTIGSAHESELLYCGPGDQFCDTETLLDVNQYYTISNGNAWTVCTPSGQSIVPSSSAITVGESPSITSGTWDPSGVVVGGSENLNNNPQVGGYVPTQGSIRSTISPIDEGFFDGITIAGGSDYDYYYPEPSRSTDFISRYQSSELCVQDGVCQVSCCNSADYSNCTLDPDCVISSCNNATDGVCDYDCPRGNDPDCAIINSPYDWVDYLHNTFLCTEMQDDYVWAQCCPDTESCYNASGNPLNVFVPGEQLSTIKEFPCPPGGINQNCGLIIGFQEDLPPNNEDYKFTFLTDQPSWVLDSSGNQITIPETVSKVPITDWSEYDYLEFYVAYFANFELNLTIYGIMPEYDRQITDPATRNAIEEKIQLFGPEKVVNYAVQEPALRRWLHIKIPLGGADSDLRQAKVLALKLSASREVLSEMGTIIDYRNNLSDSDWYRQRNIIALDKILLSKANESENRICSENIPSASFNRAWIRETELSSSSVEGSGNPVGVSTCQKIPGYGWTGTQCCGSSQDKNHTSGLFSVQSYIDTEHACLSGTIVKNNTLVDINIP